MAGLALVVVAALLVAVVRQRAQGHPEVPSASSASATRPPAAGHRPALGDDPRSAVIADYLAMERELARARMPREPFETPAELLERAGRGGLETTEARLLAGLFTRARYSSRDVSADQREQAHRSLAAVRSRWADGPRSTTAPSPGGEET